MARHVHRKLEEWGEPARITPTPSVESREVVYDDHQLQPLVRNYKQIIS
jgi:hypothetical protein